MDTFNSPNTCDLPKGVNFNLNSKGCHFYGEQLKIIKNCSP